MIAVPIQPETILGWLTPIQGDIDEPIVAAKFLRDTRLRAEQYRQHVANASMHLNVGRSRAVSATAEKLQTHLAPGVDHLISSALDAQEGFTQYASNVDDIHSRAKQLRDRVEAALTEIYAQTGEITEILEHIQVQQTLTWRTRISIHIPTPVVPAETEGKHGGAQQVEIDRLTLEYSQAWFHAATKWNDALDTIDSAPGKWESLISERIAAERLLLSRLQTTTLGRLIQMSSGGSIELSQLMTLVISGEIQGRTFLRESVANSRVEAIIAAALTPEELAQAWSELELTREEIASLPIETLVQLACEDSLPAWVQDIASIELLYFAMLDTSSAYVLMGFGGDESISLPEFRDQMLSLYVAWQDAQIDMGYMVARPTVQLIGLGCHDGALTAAISHGDLDTATHVGINVSGMNSNVDGIGNDAAAARSLFRQASIENKTHSYALVTWIGYRSPDFTEVNAMDRAEAGGEELARFINGLSYSREAQKQPIGNLVNYAHSHGSTVTAVALRLIDPRFQVDSFVSYGSAGFEDGFDIENLYAEHIYAAMADGDQLAALGRLGAHSVNPITLTQVREVPTTGGEGYWRVTSHNMYTEVDPASPGNNIGKVGYLTQNTRSLSAMARILTNGSLD